MKKIILILIILSLNNLYSQEKQSNINILRINDEDNIIEVNPDTVPFEKPFNFFAAAGVSYRIGIQYNVTISPIDYTVQFQEINPVITRFSLGLVWNPIKNISEKNIKRYIKNKKTQFAAKAIRSYFAVALLVNVFQLAYSSDDFSTSTPVDVGFGIGYRNSNFLILFTAEFTPVRMPRQYFIDDYNDKNKQLILSGNSEPERTINLNDNSIFFDKIFPSFGVKIAYAFSGKKN